MLHAIEGVKEHRCSYCNRITTKDLDELAKHPNDMYNEKGDRIGWSAYRIGTEVINICLKCRNTKMKDYKNDVYDFQE